MALRTGIIDVLRKPQKCPVCGENVVDIIYGTGDMTNLEFLLQYRREGIVAGDFIPRRPPIWACRCGCKRFRKVNWDGTDAPVKVKLLKNIRPKPLKQINFAAKSVSEAVENNRLEDIRHYMIEVVTELGEKGFLVSLLRVRRRRRGWRRRLLRAGELDSMGLIVRKFT